MERCGRRRHTKEYARIKRAYKKYCCDFCLKTLQKIAVWGRIDMVQFIANAMLSRCCTFLTGGRARRLAYAYNTDELADCAAGGALVIGRGSNVLFGDDGYDGDVAVNRTNCRAFAGETCVCDSGVLMSVLAREYAATGREGLSWAYGLPGSVGGAVVGNAGAFGGCMADVVQSVTVLFDGKVRTLTADECGFSYRHSDIRGTVLRLTLKAKFGDGERIRAACESNLRARKSRQPLGASAGSVFKKVSNGAAAGELIDRAGLKGLCAGGAVISDKHANFILNRGGATSGDIVQLIGTAQAVVYDAFGIRLEREIKLLGDFF